MMTLAIVAFVGFVVGRTLEVLAKDRCSFVGNIKPHWSSGTDTIRCRQRDGHDGPHELREWDGPAWKTHWQTDSEKS